MEKIINFYTKQDKIIFWANFISLALVFFIFLLSLLQSNSLPSQIPLFYSLPWGEKQLVSTSQFLILPFVILIIILINIIITWHLHPSQLLFKRLLSISSILVSLLMFVTALKIIFIFI